MENFGYTRMYLDGGSAENQIMQAAQQLVGAAMLGDELAQQQLLLVAAVGIQAISQLQQLALVARKGAKLKNGGGCGCKATLKRVGGRVVNVGCNGLPINRLGGDINKFEEPSGGIDYNVSYQPNLNRQPVEVQNKFYQNPTTEADKTANKLLTTKMYTNPNLSLDDLNINNPDPRNSGTVPGTSYKDMLRAFVKLLQQ